MAQNVILPGAGAAVAADLITGDASLGTADVQYVKLMDGTIGGTTKAAVSAQGLKVDVNTADFNTGSVVGAAAGVLATLGPMNGISFALLRINAIAGGATINVQASLDGTNYSTLAIGNIGLPPSVNPITAVGTYGIPGAAAFKYLQLVQVGAGSCTVVLQASAGDGSAKFVYSLLPDAFKSLAHAAVTSAPPAYTPGTSNPHSMPPWGGLRVDMGGFVDVLNITVATVIKASPGRLAKVSVVVAGTGDGTVNDCTTTGAAAVANQFGAIPAGAGISVFDWPCGTGIVVVPGAGQTLAVSYS
jgi:hypothetical protein